MKQQLPQTGASATNGLDALSFFSFIFVTDIYIVNTFFQVYSSCVSSLMSYFDRGTFFTPTNCQYFVPIESPNTAKISIPKKAADQITRITQTKAGEEGNDRRFYKTLINLFLSGKSRLWYAESRYSSLTFLQLKKKNSPDPKGLLGWTHQLEPTSRDCIRDSEIPPNRRINSIWIEFTSIAEKNVFQFIIWNIERICM